MAQSKQPATLLDHPLVDGNPPPWATAWGQDEYGIYAEFTITNNDVQATQRMRWLPAGRFTMGSPEDEPGRHPHEGPQHEVTLTRSFWIFDTPCTQRLWRAVMGENPSRFVDDERPVEQVSWEDAVAFANRVAELQPLLPLSLLTEAQWEYACRGGTTDATYAGPIEIRGKNDAPILHEIAWYGGNSGVDFDLDWGHGWDSESWPEKQFNHARAATRRVARKEPTAWGMFDMLGNVWEWCSDWLGDYEAEDLVDPAGPTDSHSRVLRGGSWNDTARLARSACRYGDGPGYRSSYIGFRCALVQEG